ncbi:MAG: hypothetical protein KME60_01765 [Cyanomargarita calcarea GSE-NOS-MK-12-04C]|uniref:Uncharacterized protein n=1 Tax=Cyanomargarita calcarea GSE-NOS-MK-12-04C TaxID=2839659 RepID=A0A951QIX1_9CYAN|nr:hypothetical protein [Cyanomargarita calcarea GSE-NOS-MK-12-04C]
MFSKFGYWKFAIGTLLLPVCLGFETAYGKDGVQNQLAAQIQVDTSVVNSPNLLFKVDSSIKNQEANTDALEHANYYAHHCNCGSSHRRRYRPRRHYSRRNYHPQRHHYQNIYYQHPRRHYYHRSRHHHHCNNGANFGHTYSYINHHRHNGSQYLHRYQHFGRHQYRHGYHHY